MNIDVILVNQVAVVVPDGDLTPASAVEMKRTLRDLLDNGNTRFVVDMGRAAYMDSAVWGELAAAAARARAAGGELRVCAMSGELLAIAAMLRLSRVMAVFDTREHAMLFDTEPVEDLSRALRSPLNGAAVTSPRLA